MAKKSQNELYFDASLLHQIAVRRFTTLEIKELLNIIEKADIELSKKLRDRLPNINSYQSKRLENLLLDIKEARKELMKGLSKKIKTTLVDFIESEAAFENQVIDLSLNIALISTGVPLNVLKEAVFNKPFAIGSLGAQDLNRWLSQLSSTDLANITNALQLGIVNGESIKSIITRVIGTGENNFNNGILAITRRNLETVVRTAINHATNTAREEVWKENQDIISGLRWTSTLDGRTSAICRSRDGLIAPIGDKPIPNGFTKLQPVDARPPAHARCRSIMVAIFDGIGVIGRRPFISDTRTGEQRQIDFEAEAKAAGVSIKEYKKLWANKNVGTIPAAITYEEWLKNQSQGFIEEVLGKQKAKLFQTGKLKLTEFVDFRGKELTLAQLAKSHPQVFKLAGLNPKSY